MREIDREELKKIQLDILKRVTEFCDAHDIDYWLDFGTMIGAVRHKGYIPWDDDIDLGMLREDYDKFLKLFNGENADTPYRFSSYEVDKSAYYPFGKVLDTRTLLYEPDEQHGFKLAVYIDIFVYDNIPDAAVAKKVFKKRYKYVRMLYAHSNYTRPRGNILRRTAARIYRCFARMMPWSYATKRILKLAKRYENEPTEYVAPLTSMGKFIFKKEDILEKIYVEFEGEKYKILKNYDAWLTTIYGDYMQLPPEEQRVSHHSFKAYYI